jgi:hypothetical protein
MNRLLDYAIGVLNFICFFVGLLFGALFFLPGSGFLGLVTLALATVPLGLIAVFALVFALTRRPWTAATSGRHVLALGILNLLPLIVVFLFRDAQATGWILALFSILPLIPLSIMGAASFADFWSVIVLLSLPYVLNVAYLAYFAYRLGVSEKTADGKAAAGANRRRS